MRRRRKSQRGKTNKERNYDTDPLTANEIRELDSRFTEKEISFLKTRKKDKHHMKTDAWYNKNEGLETFDENEPELAVRKDFIKAIRQQKKNEEEVRKKYNKKKKEEEDPSLYQMLKEEEFVVKKKKEEEARREKTRKKKQRKQLDEKVKRNKTLKKYGPNYREEWGPPLPFSETSKNIMKLNKENKDSKIPGYKDGFIPQDTIIYKELPPDQAKYNFDDFFPAPVKRISKRTVIREKNPAALKARRKKIEKKQKEAARKKEELKQKFRDLLNSDNTSKSKQQSKKKSKQQQNLKSFFGDLPGDNNNNLPSKKKSQSSTSKKKSQSSMNAPTQIVMRRGRNQEQKLKLVSGKQRTTGQNQNEILNNQQDIGQNLGAQSDAIDEIQGKINHLIEVTDAILKDTTDIKGDQKESHSYLVSIKSITKTISRKVDIVGKNVREGFANLNEQVGNCMQLQHLRKNFGWCLIYLLQWLVAMVGWFHVKYTQIVKNITIGIGSIVGEVPYVGVVLKWMVYFFGLCVYIFFGLLVWSFILSRVFGPQFAFNMLINMFERAFDSMVIFFFEGIAKLINHLKTVDYLDGLRKIAGKLAGIFIRLPLNTLYCLVMYGVCQSNPFKRSGQCEKELGECIMTAINNIKNSAEEGQSGGNKDINMKELDSMIKKIRKKFKEKHGKQMYTDITKYAHASVNELIQPLKKNETYLDRIADIGSTVTGNIFSTILKNPSNKKANSEKMQKSFKTAIDLFDNMKTHIDNIADNFPKIKKEDYKIIKKYDDKKMKEIITLAKKEGLVLENKLPKVKKIIQNITICALNPKLQLNLIAFLLTYTGDINTIQSLMKRPKKSSSNVLKTLSRSIMARRSKKKRIKNPKTKKQKKGKGKNKSKKQKYKRKKSQKKIIKPM